MVSIDLTLTDLTFPDKLEDKYCKFRPLVSVRYRDSRDKIMFAREALPGLGKRDYWECERGNKNKPEYVRNDAEHKIDINKLDVTRREIIFDDLDVKKLELVVVEIFDIDVSGFWDKLRKELLTVLPVAAAPFLPALPLTLTVIKKACEKGTGKKISDLEKIVIDKAMGRDDGAARSLWVHSVPLSNRPEQSVTLNGSGIQGDYSVTINLQVR